MSTHCAVGTRLTFLGAKLVICSGSGKSFSVLFAAPPHPSLFRALQNLEANTRLAAAHVDAATVTLFGEMVEIQRLAGHDERATEAVAGLEARPLGIHYFPGRGATVFYLAHPRGGPEEPDSRAGAQLFGAYGAGAYVAALHLGQVSPLEILVVEPAAVARQHVEGGLPRRDGFIDVSPQALKRGGTEQDAGAAPYRLRKHLELPGCRGRDVSGALHPLAQGRGHGAYIDGFILFSHLF